MFCLFLLLGVAVNGSGIFGTLLCIAAEFSRQLNMYFIKLAMLCHDGIDSIDHLVQDALYKRISEAVVGNRGDSCRQHPVFVIFFGNRAYRMVVTGCKTSITVLQAFFHLWKDFFNCLAA